jgi:uncharacterized protein (DUF2147 family)
MKIILTAALLVLLLPAYAQDQIVGIWLTENGDSRVKIFKTGHQQYRGEIIGLKNPPNNGQATDRNNPDEALRGRPILGLPIIEKLIYKDGKWYGEIYTPKKGKSFDATFSVHRGNLTVRVSYMGFSREKTWTKISD